MLREKNILVGVTGSIAAYKSAMLIRLFVKEGANVKVVMTPSATEFISPLTLSTLSKNPVLIDFFNSQSGEWTSHVELGLWADAYIIAPATANSIAKFANGICEDLLAAVYLSARCPVFVAPAMDLDMYRHQATTKNIETLKAFGNTIIDADHGELASGLIGEGRMAEPEQILGLLKSIFHNSLTLSGKSALVSAGPTYEALDPVRFIGNHSSGKMGYQIAEELAARGAQVTLVSGPSQLKTLNRHITVHRVVSAEEMHDKCSSVFDRSDIVVLAAAVADYKAAKPATSKIKKTTAETGNEQPMQLELVKTVDIAESLGSRKQAGQLIVGFALETDQELENAKKKIRRKNFDLIVLNSLNDRGAGFGYDTNKVTIIDAGGKAKAYDLKSKKEVASDIVDEIEHRINV
ncbi:MAG: bifunctional phosphopantothenoylcysteine decarboxylase/phosphopantothenate--cysteine ligase CoaBC [Cyclobacteriaceae bacterium]|nr:bifunctional phosphopantothenoylcysteine decarboxylase/phosphopantothenate--cysteine ligase CoaBC [Cyclobacteriaceae bacterium]